MSFKLKIVLLFLLVGLIPYFITMVVFGNSLMLEREQTMNSELNTQLNITVERIQQHIQRVKSNVKFIVTSEVMNDFFTEDLDRRISRVFEKKKEELHLVGDFYLIDKQKRVVASSDFNVIGKNFEDDFLFCEPYISPFDEKNVANLCVNYSLENIKYFFTNSESRHYYVVEGSKELYKPVEFVNSIKAKVVLEGLQDIYIVLEEDKEYAYKTLYMYQKWFFIILVIGVLIIIVTALLFAVNLVRPIAKLSNTAKEITQTHKYDTQVIMHRNDEIGQLANSFNKMILSMNDAFSKINNLNKEIEETQKEVVFTMGAIGESRSKETGNHVKRVAEYSKLLALYYGLDAKEAEILKQASPMHDIGKVAIPDAILNKPGKFTEEEFEYMKRHAEIGYEMLKGSTRELLKAASIVAYEHHEKWDGTGYPRGLKEDDIHIYGRITALADVFDALGSDRCYKEAWSDEKIFQLFKEQRARHFDPRLVDIFFANIDEFLKIRARFQDKF